MSDIHPIFEKIISRDEREKLLGQRSKVLWFTGLSGSGKSTIAVAIEKALFDQGRFAQILDGDNIRNGINKNLGFSVDDRRENIRRIAEVAKLYLNSGVITICSFISPLRSMRSMASHIIGENDFLEIFIDAPLDICESRDVKGLYKKARAGEIKNFTGIDSPYEPPINPAIRIDTSLLSIEKSIEQILNFIQPIISIGE